jgi:flagellar motor switch protein FliN
MIIISWLRRCLQLAKDIVFNDPLGDIDPIMEQAFSVNDRETPEFDSSEDSEISEDYDFYEDEEDDEAGDEEDAANLAPTVSNIEFPALEDKSPGHRFESSVFSNIPVGISVELGRSRISLKEVFELSEGSIIELDRMVGEPLDLVVNGQIVAQGEVVAIDNNYGLRVTHIVSPI